MIKNLIKKIIGIDRFNSVNYWENRYAKGGNSGDGSYGRLSQFKADFVNKFIDKNDIKSIVELGCGDGHQLSIIHYPSYIGLDVSQTVIDLCRNKFQSDPTKRFFQYKPDSFIPNEPFKAELALSLDVLYHIVEDKYYHKYLNDLFRAC